MKKTLALILVVLLALCTFAACKKDPVEPPKPEYGTISGVVSDAEGEPLESVEIAYSEEDSIETDENGKFSIKNIKVGDVTLTVSLKGYATQTVTITSDDFDSDGKCLKNITLQEGKGKIQGVVSVDGLSSKKLAGVTVTLGDLSAITDDEGKYVIENVPMKNTRTIKATIEGYGISNKTVSSRSFDVNGVATVNFALVQNDLEGFAGIKPSQLEALEAISANTTVLRKGDLASKLIASPNGIAGTSKVESHTEGLCINADTKDDNPDLVAFIYGKVKVDDNHKYLTAYARTFFGQNGGADHDEEAAGNFSGSKLAELGVYVINEQGEIIKNVDEFIQINTEGFMPATFDLSAFAGQTITFVLGTKTGYHCCLDRIEFAGDAPQYLTVNGVDGLTSLMLHAKVTDTTFDATALQDKWTISGGVGIVTEGVQLNGADPWKAEDFNVGNPQGVNSYMYITTDITEANSQLNISATITNLEECKDPASADPNHLFYPYVSVIVLDKDGKVLKQTDWTKIDVTENKANFPLSCDLADFVGEDVTVVIACNVGYRATITGVTFGAAE